MSASRFTQTQFHVSSTVSTEDASKGLLHSASVTTSQRDDIDRKSKKIKKSLLGVLLLGAMAATIPAKRGELAVDSEGLAGQGHAKRYLRMNEYLFHGTQKATAIAMHSAEMRAASA